MTLSLLQLLMTLTTCLKSIVMTRDTHPLIFGTDKLDDCERSVVTGLRSGYLHFDTAQAYGNEVDVGNAVRFSGISRKMVHVTTKISKDRKCPSTFDESYEMARNSVNRLALDYVDLFLIHGPGRDSLARRHTWQALECLLEEGFVRSIGVSNYNSPQIEEMKLWAKVYPPKINQIELDPWCQQTDTVNFCRESGIEIQAYCSLVRHSKAAHPELSRLSKIYRKTSSQILVRYSLQKGWTPVFRSQEESHMVANIDVYDFEISSGDMETIDSWDEGSSGALFQETRDCYNSSM